jgi:hypothetical protein
MPSKTKNAPYALAWLKSKSTRQDRDNLDRFGIHAPKAFGVSIKNIQLLAEELGRDHELAFGVVGDRCV